MRARLSLPVAGVILALALVAWGAYVADWRQIGAALLGADFRFVLASLVFLFGTLVLFALRWGQLIAVEEPLRSPELFRFLMIGYLANALLPVRPGDVIRAVLLRQRHRIALSVGLASIVLERLVDLSAVCALGIVMSFLIPLPPLILSAVYAVSAGVCAFLLLLALIHRQRASLRGLVARHPGLLDHHLSRLAVEWVGRFVAGINVVWSMRRFAACAALTACGWLLLTAFMMSLITAFDLPVPLSAGLLVLIATNLGALLPLSPGAVGVYHFMVVLSLMLWRIDYSTALAFAIASHATAIGLHIVLGIACAWHEGITVGSLNRLVAARD